MSYFAVPGSLSATTTYKTGALIYATTGVLARGKVMELIFGAAGAPAASDTYVQYDVSRITNFSTNATAFVPNSLDPADAAARATAQISAVSEPTVTAASSLWNLSMNQRNSGRYAVLEEAKALIFPATANNGLAFRALSAFGGSLGTQMDFLE